MRMEGPTHRYMLSSPGCWAIFGELNARWVERPQDRPSHQYIVDTYAVQHPGTPNPQAIQSVAVHLISLYAALELDHDLGNAPSLLRRLVRKKGVYKWLTPPSFSDALTVVHLRGAPSTELPGRAREWAVSVWRAWAPHHDTIGEWYESYAVRQ